MSTVDDRARRLIASGAQGQPGLLGHLLFVDMAIARATVFQAEAQRCLSSEGVEAAQLLQKATQSLEQALDVREKIVSKLDDQQFNAIYSTLFDQ